MSAHKRQRVGRVFFDMHTIKTAIERVALIIENETRCHQIVVANSYSLVLAHKDPVFHDICQNADVVFADGQPVVWASRLLGERLPERVAGPDFMWQFCEYSVKKRYCHFFLGGREEYLDILKRNLESSFAGIEICGAYSPPFGEWNKVENSKILSKIKESKADIVWVGISTPRQDIWIHKFKSIIPAKVAIGVGAAFDFHAGRINRAPLWVRKLGLEWFHRFISEPQRLWKRYLIGNIEFLLIIFIQLINERLLKKLGK
jgi:N-acetylglucosaminyldiphosphoundecaprenol N-acetyl-beta-D-mannosaminyltransferase